MGRKLVMETTYLHQEQLGRALRDRKEATRIPVAEQIRDAVSEYLRRRGIALEDLPKSADAAEVGR